MAKKRKVDDALAALMGGDEPITHRPQSKAVKPLSVRLTADEIERVRDIATVLKVSEHAVRHFAVKRLLAEWKRGWRPKRKTVTTKTLEP